MVRHLHTRLDRLRGGLTLQMEVGHFEPDFRPLGGWDATPEELAAFVVVAASHREPVLHARVSFWAIELPAVGEVGVEDTLPGRVRLVEIVPPIPRG